jgi:pimeloyl-ACP methyl ester carboxylesterase
MKAKNSIYKTKEARQSMMALYEQRLEDLHIEYEEFDVQTFAGETHIIVTGKKDAPSVVLFHGINAGSPLTLNAVKGLRDEFRLYGVDTIGQATKSAENRLPLKDDSLARWAVDVLDELGLQKPNFIGVSYGAFLLQKLMTHFPERIEKAIFVVPGGLDNGAFIPSMTKLTLPLIRFMITKKDDYLLKFMDAFYNTKNEADVTMQKNILLRVKTDFRRPPLLTKKNVENLDAPIYGIFADNDVFFPGDKALKKCQAIFKNFAGSHILKNTKHIPEKSLYPEIEDKLREWLKQP